MWNRYLGRIQDSVAEKQDVDIDGSWAFFLHPPPAHCFLDVKNRGHELLRSLGRFQCDGTIQKPRLLSKLDRLGFVEGRHSRHPADRSQALLSVSQIRFAVADI